MSVYGRLPQIHQQRLQTIILTAASICLGRNYARASTQQLLTALKWPSILQMLEIADSKIIHQAIITHLPQSIYSRVGRPMAGATRQSASGSMLVLRKRKTKHERVLSHDSLKKYNNLSLSSKLISKKAAFKLEIKRFVMTTRTPTLRQYDTTVMAPHTERRPSLQDITYTLAEDRSLRRNPITLAAYRG